MKTIKKNPRSCIETGDINEIKNLSAKEIIEYKDEKFNTLFLFAIANGCSVEILKEIISIIEKKYHKEKCEEFIFSRDRGGVNNALHLASMYSDKSSDIVRFLDKELGFNLDRLNKKDASAFILCIRNNNLASFKYLLQNKVTILNDDMEFFLKEKKEWLQYFYSPEVFLSMIDAGNFGAIVPLVKHIKKAEDLEKNTYLIEKNKSNQNGLILAAKKLCTTKNGEDNYRSIFRFLLELDFDLSQKDNKNNSFKDYLAKYIDKNLRIQKDRTLIGNFLIKDSRYSSDGKISIFNPILEQRKYRSYSLTRERQILRHISTQLYFYLNEGLKENDIKNLVEIQTMHMEFDGRNNLFIAANQYSVTSDLIELIKNKDVLKNILISKYKPTPDPGEEGKKRSERFSEKLSKRVFGDAIKISQPKALAIATILNECEVIPLFLNYDNNELSKATKKIIAHYLNERKNTIYIVIIEKNTEILRHAEEFLVDIAEFSNEIAKDNEKEIHTCIAGKKRPCMGCSARMEQGDISIFNKKPGLFWLHSIRYQDPEVAKKTTEILMEKPSCISLAKDGVTKIDAYDTGSDSEPEEEKKSLKK